MFTSEDYLLMRQDNAKIYKSKEHSNTFWHEKFKSHFPDKYRNIFHKNINWVDLFKKNFHDFYVVKPHLLLLFLIIEHNNKEIITIPQNIKNRIHIRAFAPNHFVEPLTNRMHKTPIESAIKLSKETNDKEVLHHFYKLFTKSDPHANNKLHWLSQLGLKNEAIELLNNKSNIDVNEKDGNGCTPLCYASYFGHAEIITLLLSHGGNIDTTYREDSLLDMCIDSGFDDLETAKILIQSNINIPTDNNLLNMAITSSSFKIFQYLVENTKLKITSQSDLVNSIENKTRGSTVKKDMKNLFNMGIFKSSSINFINPTTQEEEAIKIPELLCAFTSYNYPAARYLTMLTPPEKNQIIDTNHRIWLTQSAILASDIDLIKYLFTHYRIDSNSSSLNTIPFYAAMIGHVDICLFLWKKAPELMQSKANEDIFDPVQKTILAKQGNDFFDVAKRFKHNTLIRENIIMNPLWEIATQSSTKTAFHF